MTIIPFEDHPHNPKNKPVNHKVKHSQILDPDNILEIFPTAKDGRYTKLEGSVFEHTPVNKEITFFIKDPNVTVSMGENKVNKIDVYIDLENKEFPAVVYYRNIPVKQVSRYTVLKPKNNKLNPLTGIKIAKSLSSNNKLHWLGVFINEKPDNSGWTLLSEFIFHNYLEKTYGPEILVIDTMSERSDISYREIEEVKPLKPEHTDFYRSRWH